MQRNGFAIVRCSCLGLRRIAVCYYLENEIDLILWKNRFYRPIEIERSALSHLSKPYSPADIKPLLSIIGEGIEYYTQIIKKLKHTSTVECFLLGWK